MVNYIGLMGMHYRIDALTYLHLHRGSPWSKYHEKFEEDMGHFIVNNLDQIETISFAFKSYKDIYKDTRKIALCSWYKGLELVKFYESGKRVFNDQAIEICKICIQGIGDIWTTLAKETKII